MQSTQPRCVHQLFEAQVERTPDAIAVVFEKQRLTYCELNVQANRLAHRLIQRGIGPEKLVGLCVERSPAMLIGILGILKAGGAYLPLDPAYPTERLAYMLQDAQASVVVMQQHLAGHLPAQGLHVVNMDDMQIESNYELTTNPSSEVLPDNLIYSIYTSGSTGQPKGTLNTHANVARLFAATQDWYHFNEHDVWTLFHSSAFDFSVWEMWGALLYGGRLVVVPYLLSRSPEAFYHLLCEQKVTVLNQTPSAFRQLMRVEETIGTSPELALRYVIFGGEALDLRSLASWFARHGDEKPLLVNMYGITETTVHVTYRPLTQTDATQPASLIGRPLPDLEVHVLDELCQQVQVGEPGELYVGGAGLGRGYSRPEMTALRFVPHPFANQAGARLYRSGDLVRYLPDGSLEYLGRVDDQVKVRGFRIELGEIAAVFEQHSAVREAVVVAREDIPGDQRLVAYFIYRQEERPPVSSLRNFLEGKLPEYMVPSHFVPLDAWPLTTNGKLDRRVLPAPGRDRSGARADFIAPRTLEEKELADIWCDVLGVERIGMNDNFFELGGHSLLATHIITRVQSKFQLELPLRSLFEAPTITRFLEAIEKAKVDTATTRKKPVISADARKVYRSKIS